MKSELNLRDFESDFARFDSLMPHRVKDILLVASLYDAYILEEDGQLAQMIFGDDVKFDLSYAPHIKRVSTAEEALALLETHPFDLIIIARYLSDLPLPAFCHRVKESCPDLPIIYLGFQSDEIDTVTENDTAGKIDRTFMYQGDIKIFLAIVKFVEDRWNVANDTKAVGVRVIILVEDSVRFYSAYLPLIYAEVMHQSSRLMVEGMNPAHRLLRMRARPKILMAATFEEAVAMFEKYRDYLLGIISDVKFRREGKIDPQAGLRIARMAKKEIPDLPIVLQSSNIANAALAAGQGVAFIHKRSPSLLADLRAFILDNFGFGDFVFRLGDGAEVARASNFPAMLKCLETVPEASVVYHAGRNHFSNWLMARTEFDLAARIRPRQVSEFSEPAGLRQYLIDTLRNFRRESRLGIVTDFSRRSVDISSDFVRIGEGSLGGKGRGLSFVNSLMNRYHVDNSVAGVKISIPPSAVVATSVFEDFIARNNLLIFALGDHHDAEIAEAFAQGSFSPEIIADLEAYLRIVEYPLAVRSSSLLEDSHYQPFAGIYTTHMLANNQSTLRERMTRLLAAIKYIYASIFFKNAKNYIEATGHRVEEEKMAVIIQKAIGSRRGAYFYPIVSGVARSYNFYSIGHIKPEEGVAYVALGLGKTIVEGGNCLYFSPQKPNWLPQFSSPKDFLKHSQKEYFGLDMAHAEIMPLPDGNAGLVKLDLEEAESGGAIAYVASTYTPDDDRVHDGVSRKGTRLVTFAPILKSRLFPLAEVIRFLLKLGSEAMNCPIEIEFAAEPGGADAGACEFRFLQIRPMSKETHLYDFSLENIPREKIICRSEQSLSNGRISHIKDIIYVRPDKFDRAMMPEMAAQVGEFNRTFKRDDKPYLLIGPGRWGTSDRWLGIPVTWNQISSARVIVEAAYGDFSVTPSFGTHFFQNIISAHIGYLTVNEYDPNSFIDWEWLSRQKIATETEYIRHISLENSVEVLIDGRRGHAAVLKPE